MKCFICLKGKTNCEDGNIKDIPGSSEGRDKKNNHWHSKCLKDFKVIEEDSSFWTWIYSFF